MNTDSRPVDQRESDLVRTAELYLKGWSQYQIADEVKVSQGTISNDLKLIRERWKEAMVETYNELQHRELARVDNLEATYWEEWDRSKGDKTTTTKKGIEGVRGDSREASERTEGRLGDPRYLEGVRWCIDKRCKILGLDAPIRTQNADVVGVLNISDADLENPEIAVMVAKLTHTASQQIDEMAKPGGGNGNGDES